MPRDYIMRLVEQIAQMLASVIAKRRAGQHDEAKRELDAMCLEHIGLSLDFVRRASPEAVSEALANSGALRPVRSVALAELLIQDAEMCDDAGRAAPAAFSRLHAFCLLADNVDSLTRDEQAIYRPKLDQLARQLEVLRDNPFVGAKLRQYAERPVSRAES